MKPASPLTSRLQNSGPPMTAQSLRVLLTSLDFAGRILRRHMGRTRGFAGLVSLGWSDPGNPTSSMNWRRLLLPFAKWIFDFQVSPIPAKAGTRNPVAGKYAFAANGLWIPAFAGMTVNMTTPPNSFWREQGSTRARIPGRHPTLQSDRHAQTYCPDGRDFRPRVYT